MAPVCNIEDGQWTKNGGFETGITYINIASYIILGIITLGTTFFVFYKRTSKQRSTTVMV